MADEFIHRNYLIKQLYLETDISLTSAVMQTIETFPAADVQPIRRGHWYHNTSKYVSELDAYFIQACCSCCGRYSDRIDQYSQIMSNETCSHCGADMRGER